MLEQLLDGEPLLRVLAQQAVEQVLGLVAVTWGIAMVHYVGRHNSAVQQCITTVQYAVHYMGHYNSALTVHYVVHYIVQYIVQYMVHYTVHHTVAVEQVGDWPGC